MCAHLEYQESSLVALKMGQVKKGWKEKKEIDLDRI